MHPHLFHLGPLTIPTYGIIAALGLVLAMLLAQRCARLANLNEDAVWDLCLAVIVGTLVISRIVLVTESLRSFVRYPLLVLTLPSTTRFGLLISLVCGLLYALYRRLPLLRLADVLSAPAMLLGATLHLGDYFAGEDIGAATTSIWGRLIPGTDAGIGSHATSLYAFASSVLIAALAYLLLAKRQKTGEVIGATLVTYATSRFLIDLLRPIPFGTVTLGTLALDQWLLLALVCVGGVLLLDRRRQRNA